MAMKNHVQRSAHLQAMFARKREMEHNHRERTQAVQKYYDYWGKVTSRFEDWSSPEYCKQAEEKIQHTKEAKEKEKLLESRRAKLRQLLENEKEKYKIETAEKEKGRRSKMHNTTTLEKINEKLKEEQTLRRRLELEAKLYGKWRHGVDDENLIYESKSDNAVVAKLNWLDKQVEKQMEREKEEKESKQRDLRLQEELNKAEELQKERQAIREQEIREIRALQEMHMEQLKERQTESSLLKEKEQKHRDYLNDIDKELELLEESYATIQQPSDFGGAFNLTKIKVHMRQRSEVYRNHINLCLSILQRCLPSSNRSDSLNALKERLAKQLDSEMYHLRQIDSMYESEAKYNLQKCEELWRQHSSERYKDLKDVLHSERVVKTKLLNDILMQQNDLIDMRSTHLNVIENTNEKLNQLIKEEEESPRTCMPAHHAMADEERKKSVTFSPVPFSPTNGQCLHNSPRSTPSVTFPTNGNEKPFQCSHNSPRSTPTVPFPSNGNDKPFQCSNNSPRSTTTVPFTTNGNNKPTPRDSHRARGLYNHNYDAPVDLTHASNSFSHLNLNVWDDETLCKRDSDTVRLGGQASLQVVNANNAERPRYGRKRVAWT